MMELILLRHGETEWSRSGQHTGCTDIPLTDQGRAEAAAASILIRRLLHDELPPHVYSSPLKRALETAEIVLPAAAIEQHSDLVEMDYGDHEGLTTPQIRELSPGWDMWRDGCPNGESVEQVGDRVDRFLASMAAVTAVEDHGRPLVVVAHGHLIRILAARAVGLEAANGRILTLDTATVSMISELRGERVLKLWNVPAHLG